MNDDASFMAFLVGSALGGFVGVMIFLTALTLQGELKTNCDQILIDAAHERYEEDLISDVLMAREFICLEEHN